MCEEGREKKDGCFAKRETMFLFPRIKCDRQGFRLLMEKVRKWITESCEAGRRRNGREERNLTRALQDTGTETAIAANESYSTNLAIRQRLIDWVFCQGQGREIGDCAVWPNLFVKGASLDDGPLIVCRF